MTVTNRVGVQYIACSLLILLFGIGAHADLATVSGRIVDSDLKPISGAQVFFEPGLTRSIQMVRTEADGAFSFENVPPERVGIFAYADGYSFNGKSIWLGSGDAASGHSIVLTEPGKLSIQVTENKKKPVSGAHAIRILLQNAKVSIPFSKIRSFGFQVPVSGDDGELTVNRLPVGEMVVLKVAHAQFAQEAVPNVKVGTDSTRVQLTPGVLISGSVLSRGSLVAVPNAPILFRSSNPLVGTTVGRADGTGVYTIRLKPGIYVYESVGASFTSVSKPMITVSGEYRTQQVDLIVARTATIQGKVLEVYSSGAIEGARVLLMTEGRSNAVAYTDKNGEYEFTVPEGVSTVVFQSAAGYSPPQDPEHSLRLAEGTLDDAPTFWLKAIPKYSLEIVDDAKEPIAKSIVQILHPQQLGWHVADQDGLLEIGLAALPEDGAVIGFAYHPTKSMGAYFSIDGSRASDAIVQLKPMRPVRGILADENGDGLEGWTIRCDASRSGEDSVTLWHTVTNADGAFTYPGVMENLPLVYTAIPLEEHDSVVQAPALYTVNDEADSMIPAMIVPGGKSGESLQGKSFPWRSFKRLPGNEAVSESTSKGTIVFFANVKDAPMVLDSFEAMSRILTDRGLRYCLVTEEPLELKSDTVALFVGERPGGVQTYVLSSTGEVRTELIGVPDFGLVRAHSDSTQ